MAPYSVGYHPADTRTRGIYLKAVTDSSSVFGPSVLSTTDWPFIPYECVIIKIRLKGPLYVDDCLETSSSFVTDVTSIKHPNRGSIGEGLVPLCDIKELSLYD